MGKGKSELAKQSTIFISVFSKENNWVTGFCDEYVYKAKVLDSASKSGIDNGCVSKLCIWRYEEKDDHIISVVVSSYDGDRGWDTHPTTAEEKTVLSAILFCLKEWRKGHRTKGRK